MRKRIVSLLLSLALIFSMPSSFSAKALEIDKKLDKEEVIEVLNEVSDNTLKISTNDGQVFISGKVTGNGIAGKAAALKFLDDNKTLFNIDSIAKDLQILSVEKDELGHTFVKFEQVIDGIKVSGSRLNVNFDSNGAIVSINGNLLEDNTVYSLGNKKIYESEAVEIAKDKFTFDELRFTPEVEKLILTKDKKNYEVFKVNISYMSPDIGNYDVYVEATSGEVIQVENNIRYGSVIGTGIDVLGKTRNINLYQSGNSYQMADLTKEGSNGLYTYDMKNGTVRGFLVSNNTATFNLETHKASVSAHYNAGKVVDFYKNLFNRNGLDNNGMVVASYTHYGYNYNNAFWTGNEMVYGDGDGTTFTYLSGDLDVVGHEMTHGVIQHTANLYYHNESGALNESIADVFGVLIASYDKYNVASGGTWTFNTADWVIGDDIYTPYIQGDALRSLSKPTLYGQPDNMSNYQHYPDTEEGDYGGVHVNSGIPNKAAYNIAKSIGMEKTARVYYRALVNYIGEYADFEDAKNCLVQAATDLYGRNSTEVTAIKNAFISVGIGQAEEQSGDGGLTGVDLIYANAYNATVKALEIKTQKSINEARTAINELKKVLPNHNAIPTWSSLVDTVQHPIFVQIVDNILELQGKVSRGEKITQAEVNKLRTLQLNDMEDNTDNIPTEYLNGARYGWSEFTDGFQQVLLNKIVESVLKAEENKTQSTVDAAQILIDDVSTSVSTEIVQWAKQMEARLKKVIII